MKKISWAFVLAILFLAIFSIESYAKGGSSGGPLVKPASVTEEAQPDCESFITLKERVACRLEFGQPSETTPEPCRHVNFRAACSGYYKDAVPCYELSGKEKDRCFKQTALFSEITVNRQLQKEKNLQPVRYYILALLYDLEERIEDAYNDNLIEKDDAAQLISDIVEIKIKLLKEEPIPQIREKLNTLREKWPEGVR